MIKKTTEQFIVDAIKIHGNKYDYSKVDYKNNRKKVEIICEEHGSFFQTPMSHLHKNICKKCSIKKQKLSTKSFIEKANKVHNNKYDYSKVDYIGAHIKVEIICEEHGSFFQIPGDHLFGRGCVKCGYLKSSKLRKKTTKEFIIEANEIHNGLYNYDKSVYIDSKTKLEITCHIHGSFWQNPNDHLNNHGCLKCCNDKRTKTTEQFIVDAIKVHDDLYNYDKSIYINSNKKVEIICEKHGSFLQSAKTHLAGRGCPNCNTSKGENKIKAILTNNKIKFIQQKTFDECKYKQLLHFDFYVPENNLCIEYDGEQHFKPVEYWGGEERFKKTKIRDEIKNNYCNVNKINLLRIAYNENIEETLRNNLCLNL